MISTILADSWRVYREHFGVIAAVVVAVWLPCDLLSSYFDAFVFAPDDFRKSFRFARLLAKFIGIIATIGVTFVALNARADDRPEFGSAMGAGFRIWGRFWWTELLFTLAVVIGLVLLIIPGIYFFTRLYFFEAIVVEEGLSGTKALQRSYDLTKDRFWPTFRLGLVVFLLMIVPIIVVYLPVVLVPALDHWLIDAGAGVVCDVIAAFATVAVVCGYRAYSNDLGKSESQSGGSGWEFHVGDN